MNRSSTRSYKPEMPDREIVDIIIKAGQQAPFSSQLYSVILRTGRVNAYGAPLSFIICLDAYKLKRIMEKRAFTKHINGISLLLLGIQDSACMAQNMVIAAESLGLGSCFIGKCGMLPSHTMQLIKEHHLPKLVLPLVEMVMGFPADDELPLPRYPISFAIFENTYPELSDEQVEEAIKTMDEGFIENNYYNKRGQIRLPSHSKYSDESNDDIYSWSEHISRKWSFFAESQNEILAILYERGFLLEEDC